MANRAFHSRHRPAAWLASLVIRNSSAIVRASSRARGAGSNETRTRQGISEDVSG